MKPGVESALLFIAFVHYYGRQTNTTQVPAAMLAPLFVKEKQETFQLHETFQLEARIPDSLLTIVAKTGANYRISQKLIAQELVMQMVFGTPPTIQEKAKWREHLPTAAREVIKVLSKANYGAMHVPVTNMLIDVFFDRLETLREEQLLRVEHKKAPQHGYHGDTGVMKARYSTLINDIRKQSPNEVTELLDLLCKRFPTLSNCFLHASRYMSDLHNPLRDHPHALELAQRAEQLQPNDADVYHNCGMVYRTQVYYELKRAIEDKK
eukprot:CAMPEP_0198368166 /NCGR_PEP_ID=MMETSP1450-20131203/155557_1 /TAXON_ID=753684 ORGANISM="Madagascaria erythrocladiodes, Strain CCMP3234" /NCGR_SAMPLE_ID=MMETSP1450 /ASSEMBLY_ACC=CAM_ASM_001115 /LENGTH=265 /DNA_ID=CAMNT_0044075665 /DNA_START=441 /DNA_END=1235 /DNA_ORIENTATION=+